MSKIPSVKSNKTIVYDVIKDGAYPGRFISFVGLGIQEQQPYQGKKKSPAFTAHIGIELVGKDATGKDGEGKPIEPRPAVVFGDMPIFPGAKRGKAFDLAKCLDPSVDAVPGDLDWFISRLGEPLVVTVGNYTNTKGVTRNKIASISRIIEGLTVADARADKVGFDPYDGSDQMREQHSKLAKFQYDILAKAIDSGLMPFVIPPNAEAAVPAEETEEEESGRNF